MLDEKLSPAEEAIMMALGRAWIDKVVNAKWLELGKPKPFKYTRTELVDWLIADKNKKYH